MAGVVVFKDEREALKFLGPGKLPERAEATPPLAADMVPRCPKHPAEPQVACGPDGKRAGQFLGACKICMAERKAGRKLKADKGKMTPAVARDLREAKLTPAMKPLSPEAIARGREAAGRLKDSYFGPEARPEGNKGPQAGTPAPLNTNRSPGTRAAGDDQSIGEAAGPLPLPPQKLAQDPEINYPPMKMTPYIRPAPENPCPRHLENDFHGINVPETLAYFELSGGYCDCEVLHNVRC